MRWSGRLPARARRRRAAGRRAAEGDPTGADPSKPPTGRRDPAKSSLPVEEFEIVAPELKARAERIGLRGRASVTDAGSNVRVMLSRRRRHPSPAWRARSVRPRSSRPRTQSDLPRPALRRRSRPSRARARAPVPTSAIGHTRVSLRNARPSSGPPDMHHGTCARHRAVRGHFRPCPQDTRSSVLGQGASVRNTKTTK